MINLFFNVVIEHMIIRKANSMSYYLTLECSYGESRLCFYVMFSGLKKGMGGWGNSPKISKFKLLSGK